MSDSFSFEQLLAQFSQLLINNKSSITTAESCTGGGIAMALTDMAGSSQWFERGFVTYANKAKHEMLAVPEPVLERHGAVSKEVAESMVLGALQHSDSTMAVAVTGIAGPGGGSDEKPVGTVYIACGDQQNLDVVRYQFLGGRQEVRQQTIEQALLNSFHWLEKQQCNH